MKKKECLLDHKWEVVEDDGDFMTKKCRKCQKVIVDKRYKGNIANTTISFGSKGIPGYSSPGYNEGLGCMITSKSDYVKKCKEKGAIPTE